MKKWKNIEINLQNIEYDNGRSCLIKMPNKSDYKGYKFWHPSKLIRRGKNSYSRSLGYNDDFEFKLIKTGNGKYNKFDVLDEKSIDVKEFEKVFEIMNENIVGADNDSYLIVEEPKKVEEKIEIKEEFKNE